MIMINVTVDTMLKYPISDDKVMAQNFTMFFADIGEVPKLFHNQKHFQK